MPSSNTNSNSNKDAIVFILDTFQTMSTPTTGRKISGKEDEERINLNRIATSIEMIENMIVDIMNRSKTNEIGLLLLHTEKTHHHLYDQLDDYKNQKIKNEPTMDDEVCDDVVKSDGIKIDLDSDFDVPMNTKSDFQTNSQAKNTDNSTRLGFDHITELIPLQRPTIYTLREIRSIINDHNNTQTSSSFKQSCGGFINGIIVATDVLYTKTYAKKFNRKIVLFTDGEHPIQDLLYPYMDVILESMRDMNCELIVYGFGFMDVHCCLGNTNNDNYDDNVGIRIKNEEEHSESQDKDLQNEIVKSKHESDNPDPDIIMKEEAKATTDQLDRHTTLIKSENQKLLNSLVQYTSGKIHSIYLSSSTNSTVVTTLVNVGNDNGGGDTQRNYKKTTLFRNKLNIAPNGLLSIPVRVSAYTTPSKFPTLKAAAVVYDTNTSSSFDDNDDVMQQQQQKVVKIDALGDEVTTGILKESSHWDIDKPEVEVELKYRTKGYLYGSDVIPVNQYDLEGLKYCIPSYQKSSSSVSAVHNLPPFINILGYTSLDAIPMRYWMGPIDMVSPEMDGDTSYYINTCKIFSSIAQALYELKKVAICTHIAKKNGNPRICILSPFLETKIMSKLNSNNNDDGTTKDLEKDSVKNEKKIPPICHMVLVKIPFADDVQNLNLYPIDNSIGDEKALKVCDDLIDQFMLPSNVLQSETIPNPALNSFYKTVVNRAISNNKIDKVIITRRDGSKSINDEISTPRDLLDGGTMILKRFREIFPLEVVENNKEKKKKKKFWHDLEMD